MLGTPVMGKLTNTHGFPASFTLCHSSSWHAMVPYYILCFNTHWTPCSSHIYTIKEMLLLNYFLIPLFNHLMLERMNLVVAGDTSLCCLPSSLDGWPGTNSVPGPQPAFLITVNDDSKPSLASYADASFLFAFCFTEQWNDAQELCPARSTTPLLYLHTLCLLSITMDALSVPWSQAIHSRLVN